MIKMNQTNKLEVAKCPDCETSIFVDHPYTCCSNCGGHLSQEIQSKLPKLDKLRESLADKDTQNSDLPNIPIVSAPSDLPDALPPDSSPTRSLIWKLRDRAAGLRAVAGFIMAGIVLLVLTGILIFLYAGYNAQKEASPITLDALGSMNEVHRSLEEIRKSLQLRADGDTNKTNAALEQLGSFEKTVKQNISDLRQDLGDNRLVVPVLVSSVSQRIGIIVLLIFLLQILVPTYRYNHKLAAYYAARADALELMSKIPDNKLETLVEIFSPDALDFGKTITSPAEQVLEVVKEAIRLGQSSTNLK
jgi:hypothetical protein